MSGTAYYAASTMAEEVRRSVVPDFPGAPRPPAGCVDPVAQLWPVGAPGLAGAPAPPLRPGSVLAGLPELAPGSPWAQRGARVSCSLGFRDR